MFLMYLWLLVFLTHHTELPLDIVLCFAVHAMLGSFVSYDNVFVNVCYST